MNVFSRGLRNYTTVLLVSVFFMTPLSANAANVFGGRVSLSIPCFNMVTWNFVGSPRGGLYIWSPPPFTKTYAKGIPASGKYVLGLYGIPYFCIVSPAFFIVFPGINMVMVGTS